MRHFFALILLFSSSITFANDQVDIRQLRQRYYAAVQSSSVTEKLYGELKKQTKPSPIILAYIGSLEALKAKHALNPYYKIQYLKAADQTMRKAVKADPDNLEIRFLRYSYQYYVPEFLGYSEEKKEDVAVIVAQISAGNFRKQDKDLVKNVLGFLEETKAVSLSELNKLNAVLAQH